MTPLSDDPDAVSSPTYYQLKAELDVNFRRYVKEMADEILRRIDRLEVERREERKELEQRLRTMELRVPDDLFEQLRLLHDQTSQTRATGKLMVTIFGFALTLIGLAVAIASVLH